MAYGDYLEKMSKSGEWGDHVTLQAAVDLYDANIGCLSRTLATLRFSRMSKSRNELFFFELLGRGALQLNLSIWRCAGIWDNEEEEEKRANVSEQAFRVT
ncbi:OVARIAN TUMOR DOMAIN-containing deubiquitinating enzyme 10 [Gossypium raimondii]|uniref:OVARIAN TUMOR DOMAIN-containing deubiquitinating enzyme 10 n=1 Tax=Gossypium raimondii TaxID=29730 RepID=UPI00227A8B9B|nr:OVARIAN TUMOR DOMAIN-containing deubiquitinating enzyme 10 [Gossypium raimondii]XP_052482934.1 OVARIAN TUMOR DOMAIN-containing deubiquitinating enzyme 10 [Gossypium raimondii]